ncbi:MAG: XRE family transcriptional regulator [Nostoc sp. S4]|nr:XRE family transcriptional regulator [Nostoc sp. S4]
MQKILHLLRPLMENESQRRGYLFRALGTNTPVQYRLNLNAPTNDFIPNLVNELLIFGEIAPGQPAFCTFINVIREDVGVDIQRRIDTIIREVQGTQTSPHLLFDLLLQMDFKSQARLVKNVMESHRTAAFLIHGEPYCGQQILVNRLFRLKPQWKNISPIKIDVSHNGAGRSILHLWRQLATWFGLPKNTEAQEIIHKICDRFLTQDVILIFYTVDYMPPKVLEAWLQKFWEPLVMQVERNCHPNQRDKHLLMFLVDNSGSVCKSNILLAQQFDEPAIPLHLPPVSRFSSDVLDDWIDMVTAIQSMQIPSELTSSILLKNSDNGIPGFVYEEICDRCGHNWEGGLAKWLI